MASGPIWLDGSRPSPTLTEAALAAKASAKGSKIASSTKKRVGETQTWPAFRDLATADAVPAPASAEWTRISAEKDEYRHVAATGTFDHAKAVLVQAVTECGAGFWVVTPLLRDDGSMILINRGFVPADRRDPASRAVGDPAGLVSVSGLLRITEPGGGFLRSNDPAGGRWYSRDVAAIAAAEGLTNVAPYFIDADASANPGGLPVGGLTVVKFRNSHLVYALTWYSLAIMSAVAVWFILHRRAV